MALAQQLGDPVPEVAKQKPPAVASTPPRQKRRPGQQSSGGSGHSRRGPLIPPPPGSAGAVPSSGVSTGPPAYTRRVSFEPSSGRPRSSPAGSDGQRLHRRHSFEPSSGSRRGEGSGGHHHHHHRHRSPGSTGSAGSLSSSRSGGGGSDSAWAKLVARTQSLEEDLATERASKRLLAMRAAQEKQAIEAKLAKSEEEQQGLQELWKRTNEQMDEVRQQLQQRESHWQAERSSLIRELERLRSIAGVSGAGMDAEGAAVLTLGDPYGGLPPPPAGLYGLGLPPGASSIDHLLSRPGAGALTPPPRAPLGGPVPASLAFAIAEDAAGLSRGAALPGYADRLMATGGDLLGEGGEAGGGGGAFRPLMVTPLEPEEAARRAAVLTQQRDERRGSLLRTATLHWRNLTLAMCWRSWHASTMESKLERQLAGASLQLGNDGSAAPAGGGEELAALSRQAVDLESDVGPAELARRVAAMAGAAAGTPPAGAPTCAPTCAPAGAT